MQAAKEELEIKRIDGIANPCVVVEVTLPDYWWCAKQIRWYDMKTTQAVAERSYDKSGKLSRFFVTALSRLSDHEYKKEEWWPYMVQFTAAHDYENNYRSIGYWSDSYVNAGVPDRRFTESFLTKEETNLFPQFIIDHIRFGNSQ